MSTSPSWKCQCSVMRGKCIKCRTGSGGRGRSRREAIRMEKKRCPPIFSGQLNKGRESITISADYNHQGSLLFGDYTPNSPKRPVRFRDRWRNRGAPIPRVEKADSVSLFFLLADAVSVRPGDAQPVRFTGGV